MVTEHPLTVTAHWGTSQPTSPPAAHSEMRPETERRLYWSRTGFVADNSPGAYLQSRHMSLADLRDSLGTGHSLLSRPGSNISSGVVLQVHCNLGA